MNKGDLINAVAKDLNTTAANAKATVEKFSGIIRDSLLVGNEVTIPGVGKLKVSVRAGRSGRNPKTGEAISIPEKRIVKFTPSAEFKGTVSRVPTQPE